MKLFQKIRAFFTIKGTQHEMQLKAAEVKGKGIFLHPADDKEHIFFIKSKDVDIFINPEDELTEEDISIIDAKTLEREKATLAEESQKGEKTNNSKQKRTVLGSMFSKKRFSVMLYADEYDMLMEQIKKHGYKRAEYFMACVTSAKKQSFDSLYKKYTTDHKDRQKSEKEKKTRNQPVLNT